ncbi:threonine--tRNA ligase [Leptospira sp. GIMC2001]|uniref:threonine--tRNA ligase n=1 Tax=Leptospira sp. GIMC2001 TaxID=1513297 RepID=UPI002349AC4E|nr:threonine--tRNA ligase [Leptospira sp. GIMC2001]WCL51399.1 threonine--tRNA ligase [Leptospira sp. GIMC2001]
MINITLPDGSSKSMKSGQSFRDFIAENLNFLKSKALGVIINNNQTVDLSFVPVEDCKIQILTFADKQGKEIFHHSSAHLLGQAVQRLWKDAKLTVGPVIETGPGFFYYDIDFPSATITPDDLPIIEKEMEKIVKEGLDVNRWELSRAEAIEKFKKEGEVYKVELISGFTDDHVSLYGQGEWYDLCRGPHVPNTSLLKAFKLTAISGAYWKANKDNKMLTRIYGVSFPSKKELDEYIYQIEEAKKRDHRKLGKELDLFSFQEEAPGFPFWHPKGTVLWNSLAEYIRSECFKRGYHEIKTPAILNSSLWKRSGHWDNFKENMYFTQIDEDDFAVKPMNCPGCSLVYKHHMHSYKELPIRYMELGTVHRHELSGVLHGLFRVRAFTQDDAHIFCSFESLLAEVSDIIDFTFDVYRKFGFTEFQTFIATRPEKSQGADEDWEMATNSLKQALDSKNLSYGIKEGEGAFYGPKIEFNIKDSLGRLWQCGTIQIDFSMPNRFELEYAGNDGKKHQPVMIHRAIYGSLERFIGILIEHFEGKFPLWISPIQIRVLTVAESHNEYAKKITNLLMDKGLRVEADYRNEKIGTKIRESILKRSNFNLIIGDKEVNGELVSVRKRGEENTESMSFDAFFAMLSAEL